LIRCRLCWIFRFYRSMWRMVAMVVQNLKCPECGVSVRFLDAGSQSVCDHCGDSIYANDIPKKNKRPNNSFMRWVGLFSFSDHVCGHSFLVPHLGQKPSDAMYLVPQFEQVVYTRTSMILFFSSFVSDFSSVIFSSHLRASISYIYQSRIDLLKMQGKAQ